MPSEDTRLKSYKNKGRDLDVCTFNNWNLSQFYPGCYTIAYLIIHRAPDKMRICVFHSNLNLKNSIIFGNVRIMYEKHFPDTQLCPVSKRICFVYILMECGLLPIFP